jgi:hypothetical protein
MERMAKCVTRTLDWRAGFWIVVATGGIGFGCASQSEETKHQLDTLNERILILQNDRDRLVERVDALEQHQVPGVQVTSMPSAPSRPSLKVVHLSPPATDPSADEKTEAAADTESVQPDRSVVAEAPTEQPVVPSADTTQRVVLYGEGQVSGVREPGSQELP